MRYCPTCKTEYDDEILRFCTKDGSPLLDDAKPSFTDNLPSDSLTDDDEAGEETVIRRNKASIPPVPDIPDDDDDFEEDSESSRIVIKTSESEKSETPPAGPSAPPTQPPPQKTNLGLVVFFSVLGTLIVVIGLFGIFLLLTARNAEDANSNLNVNENINANLDENIDDNFNADDLFNADSNLNVNTNMGTPTPTPTPSPSPTPTPADNFNVNSPNANTVLPTVTPQPGTPRPTVTPPPATATPAANTNSPVNVGTINGRAVTLPMPAYPDEARDANAAGRVTVLVLVDEAGRVLSAQATSGHPALRKSSEEAAMRSRFKPVSINGRTVKASGTILYNFVN